MVRETAGRVIMEMEDFKTLTKNILRLQEWSKYVESTVQSFNKIGRPKKEAPSK